MTTTATKHRWDLYQITPTRRHLACGYQSANSARGALSALFDSGGRELADRTGTVLEHDQDYRLDVGDLTMTLGGDEIHRVARYLAP